MNIDKEGESKSINSIPWDYNSFYENVYLWHKK